MEISVSHRLPDCFVEVRGRGRSKNSAKKKKKCKKKRKELFLASFSSTQGGCPLKKSLEPRAAAADSHISRKGKEF